MDMCLPSLGGSLMSTQISAHLIKELKSGIYKDAQRLPAEVELASQLSVSRTVIRDALSDLEREGFIERVRGIGTVVNRNIVKLDNRLDLKFEYNELISSAGHHPFTDSVRIKEAKASADLAEKLFIKEGDSIIICEKRILADQTPVIFSIDYLPCAILGNRDFRRLDWAKPIFDILDCECGVAVTSNITQVHAIYGEERVRNCLQLAKTDVLLLLDEISYSKLCRPVMHSLSYYTGFFDFSLLRKKF